MSPYVLYGKSGHRRPVLTRPLLFPRDTQAVIPFGWCCCGSEIYEPEQRFCPRCQNQKGELSE